MVPGVPTLRLAIALGGVTAHTGRATGGDRVREAIAWAGGAGFRGVAIDATAPGLRARELDRSARRDLAATMRRAETASAGVDLFVPPHHLTDPSTADRAVGAALGAIELATDLAALTGGSPVVAMALPGFEGGEPGWMGQIVQASQRMGARIADFAWPRDRTPDPNSPVGVGIDPGAVLAGGADPSAAVSRLATSLCGVRVSDWNGTARVPVGSGRLDELAFAVAVATSGYDGFVVADVRGIPDPRSAASRAQDRFGGARAAG